MIKKNHIHNTGILNRKSETKKKQIAAYIISYVHLFGNKHIGNNCCQWALMG